MRKKYIWRLLAVSVSFLLICKIAFVVVQINSYLRPGSKITRSVDSISINDVAPLLQTDNTTAGLVCFPATSNAPTEIASQLSIIKQKGFETLFLDLPYQAQSFVDSYISGEVRWEEVKASYKMAFASYSDIAYLDAVKPILDGAQENGFKVILMQNLFAGNNLFLTYPEIPVEQDTDSFMYDYWQKNHRDQSKDLILIRYEHCLKNPASLFGEFYTIGPGGSFAPYKETEGQDKPKSLYIKNKGYGTVSFAEKMNQHNHILLAFPSLNSFAITKTNQPANQSTLPWASKPILIEDSNYQEVPV